MPATDLDDIAPGALASTHEEAAAFCLGQAAMSCIDSSPPGQERWNGLHALRKAARLDPTAAYNLGNYFSEWRGPPARPRRAFAALSLYERAATMGLARLNRPDQMLVEAPSHERMTRELVSLALTNIGAAIANAGAPKDATEYFRRAIRLFPGNANAHVCLGNMGVWHHAATGIDPLQGVKSWGQATSLGDYCEESPAGCPCRQNVVKITRQVERDYGADAARDWLRQRFAKAADAGKKLHAFVPLAAEPRHAAALTNGAVSQDVVTAAEIIALIIDRFHEMPLEVKVTIAGSVAASLCRIATPTTAGDPSILDSAIALLDQVEALNPFLGDEEWQDLAPPETLYLQEPAIQATVVKLSAGIKAALIEMQPGITARDAVAGFMFHLDKAFRKSVVSMIRADVRDARKPLICIPATTIGAPPSLQ